MTPLNTIIEEESNALEKKIGTFTFNNGGALELTLWDIVDERVHETDEVGTVINDHLTTAMQRAYEAGRAEERLRAFEILSTYALKTETTHALDLIEQAQQEILSTSTTN